MRSETIYDKYCIIDRLGFFERRGVLLSSAQMQTQAVSHYRQQLMLQIYVVIFGLDVLGNPYGLIKDITEGLGELFYEPLLVSHHHTPLSFITELKSIYLIVIDRLENVCLKNN